MFPFKKAFTLLIFFTVEVQNLARADQPIDKVVLHNDADNCPIDNGQRSRLILAEHGRNFTGFDALPDKYKLWKFGFPTGTIMNDMVPARLRLGRYSLAEALFALTWDCWAYNSPDRFWDYIMSLYGGFIDKSWELNFVSMAHLTLGFIMYSCEKQHGKPPYCPRPCKANLCKTAEASTGSCETLGRGVFAHDYKCICRANFEWNSHSAKCQQVIVDGDPERADGCPEAPECSFDMPTLPPPSDLLTSQHTSPYTRTRGSSRIPLILGAVVGFSLALAAGLFACLKRPMTNEDQSEKEPLVQDVNDVSTNDKILGEDTSPVRVESVVRVTVGITTSVMPPDKDKLPKRSN